MSIILKDLLIELNACEGARNWVKDKSLSTAWKECSRADWMLWLIGKMADKPGWPTRKNVIELACDCAETALPIWKKKYLNDKRPQQCIEATRDYLKGKTSLEELKKYRSDAAAYAAYAAYAADAAAYAAADAAYAADAADAAYAAAYAAAAYAADAYAADAYRKDAARKDEEQAQIEIMKRYAREALKGGE